MRRIIASLDIGNHTIKVVVGEFIHNKLNVLACVDTPSRGIKKGFIVNPESAMLAIEDVFKKCEEQLGLKINKVIVSVPSDNLECFLSEGYTSINNEDGIITHKEIIKSMKDAVIKNIDESRELVALFPTKFLVDDAKVMDLPVGIKGEKLKVKVVAATVPRKNAATIRKCLEKMNIEVVDITIGPIGDYYEFKSSRTDGVVGAVINIGSSKTTVSIFNKGIITNSEVIEMGSEVIDYDLGYVYKISRNDAIFVKENIALASKINAQATESIILENKVGDKIKINQFDASEIVEGRLEEILNLAKKQINLLTKKEISYIIVTGGITEMADFENIFEYVFKNGEIGEVKELGARHNKYAEALGIIKYFDHKLKLRNKEFSIFNNEELENLSGVHKRINISEDSILGKLFGYFFDN